MLARHDLRKPVIGRLAVYIGASGVGQTSDGIRRLEHHHLVGHRIVFALSKREATIYDLDDEGGCDRGEYQSHGSPEYAPTRGSISAQARAYGSRASLYGKGRWACSHQPPQLGPPCSVFGTWCSSPL